MGTDTEPQRGDPDAASGTTDRLATFIESLSFDDLTDEDIREVERAFIDTCGVIISGMDEPPTTIAMETLAEPGSVPLWGQDRGTTTTGGAFVHGIAGHAQDYDDVSWGMSGHPSVTMIPAILALASDDACSGKHAIEAYVAGLEVQCYLSAAINPSHYERGWHSTATLGTFGAAAAAAKTLDLDADETSHALNAAASMAAGLKQNFGTMTKPMHVGQAARSGVTAARLASGGFTAAADAVDGDRGFLELYSGDEAVSYGDLPDLERPTALSKYGLNVKKYPCCYYTHTSIYAAERIAEENDIAPQEIESVRVVTSPGPADALHYPDPDTGLEGKFSLEYTVASGIARPHVGVEAFEDQNIDDSDVQYVRERVEWIVDDSLDYNDTTVEIRVETAGGTYERVQDIPPGTPTNPLSDEALGEKFRRCAGRVLDNEAVTRTLDQLDSLRTIDDVESIVSGEN
ncbi:MmgE/PrpD family protein [Natronorubrum sp. FCH18a]|uniref:MmgE/PrpD family protein n=1 Tax=Natronorubrum sp. FCH18a TaxID=3447018 RepID=UPI003F5175D8